jgi:Ca-activated chloride channel family protein
MGLEWLKKAHNPRKALVVVSDGGDNTSRYTLRDLASLAAEADAQIFTICLHRDPKTEEEVVGPALLARLARVSGGIHYKIGDVNMMTAAFEKIGVTMHSQYMLGYYPPDDAQAGKYRKIKVEVVAPGSLPRLQIFSRSGYYVP